MRKIDFPVALLEQWMREAYFESEFDIGSSGVEYFRLGDLRPLIGLELSELDEIAFHDSQTLGSSELRAAIADRYAGGQLDTVMVTHGSTEANFLIHLALVEPGAEVVVLDPVYQQLVSLTTAMGGKVVRWPLRAHDGFAPCLNRLKELLTPATKMVVVNFPHNPTGATLTKGQYSEFMEMIQRQGCWLVWDAAFAELVYDGEPLPDPTQQYERAISMGTLSKAFGLPGLRVGWCIAPPAVLEQCIRIRDYVSLHLSPLIERIATLVLRNADAVVQDRLRRVRENLALCQEWAHDHPEVLHWYAPGGGVCAFPRIHSVSDVDALCRRLVKEKVLVVPGSCFGHPQHVRMGFGGKRHELETGLQRFAEATRGISATMPSFK